MSVLYSGKKIVIDPGHGGNDAGAIGPTGVMEKTVTLNVARELRKLSTTKALEPDEAGAAGSGCKDNNFRRIALQFLGKLFHSLALGVARGRPCGRIAGREQRHQVPAFHLLGEHRLHRGGIE